MEGIEWDFVLEPKPYEPDRYRLQLFMKVGTQVLFQLCFTSTFHYEPGITEFVRSARLRGFDGSWGRREYALHELILDKFVEGEYKRLGFQIRGYDPDIAVTIPNVPQDFLERLWDALMEVASK